MARDLGGFINSVLLFNWHRYQSSFSVEQCATDWDGAEDGENRGEFFSAEKMEGGISPYPDSYLRTSVFKNSSSARTQERQITAGLP